MSDSELFDDIWSDTEPNFAETLNPDLVKLKNNQFNRGYLDGITNSKNTQLQSGFNSTFGIGSEIGLLSGKIVGLLTFLRLIIKDNPQLIKDIDTLINKNFKISVILSKKNFNDDLSSFNSNLIDFFNSSITYINNLSKDLNLDIFLPHLDTANKISLL